MAYEQKDNSGSIFRNQKREKDTHPNLTGKAMIGGVMYYVSAWTKEQQNGDKWLSLAFKPVDEKAPPKKKSDSFLDDAGDLDSTPF